MLGIKSRALYLLGKHSIYHWSLCQLHFFPFLALISFHLYICYGEIRVGCSLHYAFIQQLAGISSLLSPNESKRLNSGCQSHQPWWKDSLHLTSLTLSSAFSINQSINNIKSILGINKPLNVALLLPLMNLYQKSTTSPGFILDIEYSVFI